MASVYVSVSYQHIHKKYICSRRTLPSSMPPFLFTATQNVVNYFYDLVGVAAGLALTEPF
jgi:hypothetical protein